MVRREMVLTIIIIFANSTERFLLIKGFVCLIFSIITVPYTHSYHPPRSAGTDEIIDSHILIGPCLVVIRK